MYFMVLGDFKDVLLPIKCYIRLMHISFLYILKIPQKGLSPISVLRFSNVDHEELA